MTYDVIVRITPTKLAAHDRYQVNTQPYQILTQLDTQIALFAASEPSGSIASLKKDDGDKTCESQKATARERKFQAGEESDLPQLLPLTERRQYRSSSRWNLQSSRKSQHTQQRDKQTRTAARMRRWWHCWNSGSRECAD